MRILLTGSMGYIGSVMAPLLVQEGHEVLGVDTDFYKQATFGPCCDVIETRCMDVRRLKRCDMVGCDAVIHLAALSNDPLGELNPEVTFEINHACAVRVAELAKEAGVERFLFASSCSTYGAAGDAFVNESSELNPVTAYGRSKVLAERDIGALADDEFAPVFMRCATAFGVSPRMRVDIVLNNLVAWAYTTGKVALSSDGCSWRPLVHVQDIAGAFLAALAAPISSVRGQAFNVGSGLANYQVRTLAKIVEEIVPGATIESPARPDSDARNYRPDFSKIESILPSFSVKWDVRRGVRQLYEAYRDAKLTLEDFQSAKYRRVDLLRELIVSGRLGPDLWWLDVL